MNQRISAGIAMIAISNLILFPTGLTTVWREMIALGFAAEFLVVGCVVLHAGLLNQRSGSDPRA